MTLASQDRRKQNASAIAKSTSRERSRAAKAKSAGETAAPRYSGADEKRDRLDERQGDEGDAERSASVRGDDQPGDGGEDDEPQDVVAITAAPRMTRASSLCERPRSLRTRAVMPTLVAHSVAPRNMWR